MRPPYTAPRRLLSRCRHCKPKRLALSTGTEVRTACAVKIITSIKTITTISTTAIIISITTTIIITTITITSLTALPPFGPEVKMDWRRSFRSFAFSP